eukprot:CAMPEP_0182902118 /NCGR_PEP_ID=MMETSP0034_2-20130328/30210_1 /TAXON_ID=156128 /ORGANISM="Nephroselmis pyriformis, Strain CCMP717" /LENGTH=460 /DNA_ID=CAMNT_0025036703 /DNA_START=264 /DNA_END=1643 /DNA_ORIENTATION=+
MGDVEVREYDVSLYLGCGFDSSTGEAKGCCLDLTDPKAYRRFDRDSDRPLDLSKLSLEDQHEQMVEAAKALYNKYPRSDETHYKMKLVEDSKEVRDTMSIQGKVTVTTPTVSFEGSAAFCQTKIDRETSVNFVSSAKISTIVQRIDPENVDFQINVGSKDRYGYYDPGSVPAHVHRERFGDCFVCGVVYGGDCDMFMDMKMNEKEDSMTVRAEAKMTYHAFEASGSFSLDNVNRTKDRTVNIKCSARGGRLIHMPEEQGHVSKISSLFCGTVGGPGGSDVPVQVLIMPYAFLPAFGGAQPAPPMPAGASFKNNLTDILDDLNRIDGLIEAEIKSFVMDALPERREEYVRRLHRCRHLVLCSLERVNLALYYPHALKRQEGGEGGGPPTLPPVHPGMLGAADDFTIPVPLLHLVQPPSEARAMEPEQVLSVVPLPPPFYRYYLKRLKAHAQGRANLGDIDT